MIFVHILSAQHTNTLHVNVLRFLKLEHPVFHRNETAA